MKTARHHSYEDFVIGTPSPAFYFLRPFSWAFNLLKKNNAPQYYGTTIRRVGKTKVEVTFDLPPTVKQRMNKAIEAGKQIRLFVL